MIPNRRWVHRCLLAGSLVAAPCGAQEANWEDQALEEIAGMKFEVTCAPPEGIVLLGEAMGGDMKLKGLLALPPYPDASNPGWKPEDLKGDKFKEDKWSQGQRLHKKLDDLDRQKQPFESEEYELADRIPSWKRDLDEAAKDLAALKERRAKLVMERDKAAAHGDEGTRKSLDEDISELDQKPLPEATARVTRITSKITQMESRLTEVRGKLDPLRGEYEDKKKVALDWVKKCIGE